MEKKVDLNKIFYLFSRLRSTGSKQTKKDIFLTSHLLDRFNNDPTLVMEEIEKIMPSQIRKGDEFDPSKRYFDF